MLLRQIIDYQNKDKLKDVRDYIFAVAATPSRNSL